MFGTKLNLISWVIFLDCSHFCLPYGYSAQEESLNWKGGKYYHPKMIVKPIFNQKLGSLWVPNGNKIDTNNTKSTWPMQIQPWHTQRELYSIGSRWLRGGFALDLWRVALDLWCFALGQQVFLGNNMLVSPTRNRRVGGLNQRDDPTRVVLVCSRI